VNHPPAAAVARRGGLMLVVAFPVATVTKTRGATWTKTPRRLQMNYNAVPSDDHVQETDQTWAERVSAALRDRVR